jgi:hypothetical protein
MRIQITLDLTEEQLKVIANRMKAEGFDSTTIQEGPGAGLVQEFVRQLVDGAVSETKAEKP